MHIQVERSSLLTGCDWASTIERWTSLALQWLSWWPLLAGVAVVLIGFQLYKRAFPTRVPYILRPKASPIVADKPSSELAFTSTRSLFGIFTLDNLPVSLAVATAPRTTVGVGLRSPTHKATPTSIGLAHLSRNALPQERISQPVSMAKIIMSRHTFRKPSVTITRSTNPQHTRRPPPASILPKSRSPSPEAAERGETTSLSSSQEESRPSHSLV